MIRQHAHRRAVILDFALDRAPVRQTDCCDKELGPTRIDFARIDYVDHGASVCRHEKSLLSLRRIVALLLRHRVPPPESHNTPIRRLRPLADAPIAPEARHNFAFLADRVAGGGDTGL
jgi:hypothetical protein